jgi:hypothetical protein
LLDHEYDEIYVSVTFTWDRIEGKRFRDAWARHASRVFLGGPAYGDTGRDFVPGRFLGTGHVITSRGCPNRCWFCDVPRREGAIRELPIREGWKVHDSNLLACSREHVERVFRMLERQPHRAEFLGGLEAARLQPWHIQHLVRLKPRRIFMAYDTPKDIEPLIMAGRMLSEAGLSECYCFVLMGFAGDTLQAAERRCREAWSCGFLPRAMLYRDDAGKTQGGWRRFAREWHRPAMVRRLCATK